MSDAPVLAGALTPLLLPSGYATDRLLRLQDMLMQKRTAGQMLYGPERELVDRFLTRALFSLYLDCREVGLAGVAERLLDQFRVRPMVSTTVSQEAALGVSIPYGEEDAACRTAT